MNANSLMERRKMKLGQLKNTIQSLSILQKDSQAIGSNIFLKNNSKYTNHVNQKQEEEFTNVSSMEDAQPHFNAPKIKKRKMSYQPDQNCKTFDQAFQTHEILGEGAHGVVKKCIHKASGHQYAVKILKMEDEHFYFLKTNFINIKQLKHESVISYKALFMNSKQRKCHLVMEYLPYSNLKRGISQDQLKAVFYKLLEGLEYIHINNICHRDIKPENILYDSKNQIFKIIDFGVSKNMKLRGRYEQMLTKTGTLQYKAPQMFDGGSYTEKVDSWAVGVTLYQMIVGVTPFLSEYHGQTIDSIQHKEVDIQRDQFKAYMPVLKDLVLRLLKKNPKQRMSCQQAKKHLWFNTNLAEIDALKSANFNLLNINKNQEKQQTSIRHGFFRKSSLKQPNKNQLNQVTKAEKKVMKTYLQIMSNHPSSIQEEISIDFLESQDEQQQDLIPIKKTHSNLFDNKTNQRPKQMHIKKYCSITKGNIEA